MDQDTLKVTKSSTAVKIGITVAAVTVIALGVAFGFLMYVGNFSK